MKIKILRFVPLYVLAFLPLFSLAMTSMAIGLLLLYAIWDFIKTDAAKPNLIRFRTSLIYALPFFLYIIALLWTQDMKKGLEIVGRMASILIIPISIIGLKPFKNVESIYLFFKLYIISSFVYVVITMLFILLNIDHILNQPNSYFSVLTLRNSIDNIPLIGEHAIYFSLFVGVALLILYYHRFKSKYVNVLFGLTFLSAIAIASSRGVIAGLVIVSIIIVFQEVKSRKKAIFIMVSLVLGISAISFLTPIKSRIDEILNTKNIYPVGLQYNSFNLRVAIYDCSLNIINRSPLIGYGPGDVQNELNECYKKFDTEAFTKITYNSHNQYFDYLASFGIFGTFIILFAFYYYFKIALNGKNRLYLNFLILFYIIFLTENILYRNSGMVLFVTFNCLFANLILFEENLKNLTNI
ncbi:O-antigen ligase family protein [Arenibacter algicola]|uniref:O-antigen ligase family protein n=1 Tax=Arenibacter algicola TaxID=616991 RepID=UPI001C07AAE5|nr:O-antigen ligase family protein [Arenibacter algicola]MBU2904898.1 O-antigen ligase family protein [Arenibacter algicola]